MGQSPLTNSVIIAMSSKTSFMALSLAWVSKLLGGT